MKYLFVGTSGNISVPTEISKRKGEKKEISASIQVLKMHGQRCTSSGSCTGTIGADDDAVYPDDDVAVLA